MRYILTLNKKQIIKWFLLFVAIISLVGLIAGFSPDIYRGATIMGYAMIPLAIYYNPRLKLSLFNILFFIGFLVAILLNLLYARYNFSLITSLLVALSPFSFFIIGKAFTKSIKRYINFIITGIFIFSLIFIFYQIFAHKLYSGEFHVNNYSILELLFFRYSSFMGNSNIYAGFLSILFIFFIEKYNKPLIKYDITLLFWMVFFFLLVKSRSALLTMIILWGISRISLHKFKGFISIFILIFLFSLIFIEFPHILNEFRLFSVDKLLETKSIVVRKDMFELGKEAIENHPIIGNGLRSPEFLLKSHTHRYFESASIQILVEKGIIGYIFYLILIWALVTSKNKWLNYLGIVIIVFDFFETVFNMKQLLSFVAFLYGGLLERKTNQ